MRATACDVTALQRLFAINKFMGKEGLLRRQFRKFFYNVIQSTCSVSIF